MNLTPQSLFAAARATLSDPAGAARQVMALRLTTGEGLMAIAAMAVIDTLLTALVMKFAGPVPDTAVQEVLDNPFLLAISQFGALAFGAFLMWRVGKAFGGTGTFAKSLALTAWLEVVLLFLKVGQMLLLVVVPVLAAPVLLASAFAYFYLLTQFTAALNGFSSPLKTFAGILLTLFAIFFCLGVVIALLVPVPHV
jgi:hypothetical protein